MKNKFNRTAFLLPWFWLLNNKQVIGLGVILLHVWLIIYGLYWWMMQVELFSATHPSIAAQHLSHAQFVQHYWWHLSFDLLLPILGIIWASLVIKLIGWVTSFGSSDSKTANWWKSIFFGLVLNISWLAVILWTPIYALYSEGRLLDEFSNSKEIWYTISDLTEIEDIRFEWHTWWLLQDNTYIALMVFEANDNNKLSKLYVQSQYPYKNIESIIQYSVDDDVYSSLLWDEEASQKTINYLKTEKPQVFWDRYWVWTIQ